MNIIEAVKSGKPIKRLGMKSWITYESHEFHWTKKDGRKLIVCFIPADIISDDWEIKDEPGDS